jgi:hypothetical protein
VKRIFVVTVGLAATFGLLSACADAPQISVSDRTPTSSDSGADATIPPDLSLPDQSLPDLSIPDLSIPDVSLPDISLPPDFTIPQETIDLMIAQFEAAGMKVDRDCFTKLLSDQSLRKLVEDAGKGSGSLSPDIITKFLACLSA